MHHTWIKNPILRGFNPDPNILKVDDIFYIAVSSFEWLPGVRIYQSNDLVNWEHETDILTTQVDLRGNPQGGSIWAPQLSYADGLFHLMYTDVKSTKRPFKDSHNYLITSPSILGPWSEPIYINSSGFDPSLFHDTDGKKWVLNEIWDYRMTTRNKSAGIVMQEYAPDQQKLVGPVYKIFDGTELAKTEAPHIYQYGEYYYLITAEGGTGKRHAVTICRSKKITGPYELDPEYPMLTAGDKPDSPLQCSGHGSIVQTDEGRWYMAYLCTRPLLGKAAILGRETAIQEVYWTEDGWLRLVGGGNAPAIETEIATKQPIEQKKDTNFRDDFKGPLKKEWNTLRILADDTWCDLASRPGYLRMISGESIQSLFEHHILAIRQKDFRFNAVTKIDYQPTAFNQMAGLILYLNDSNYLYAYITHDEEKGRVIRLLRSKKNESILFPETVQVEEGEMELKIEVAGPTGQFYYRIARQDVWQQIGPPQDLLFLSGGFTGNFVGIAVHDMDEKNGSYADFDYFDYQGLDE
ncbi:glycoside hydrolase family 43 protein [Lederbergia sp. NSJ-179]|uniref:glycoside hydrolase family 43 protein n=1 Tax=Lederbergia sp. NSJ-179 TaxID=2931402 RepID=UPI001FD05A0E|nr:glycoside hydrolase family 43 protein [Lederbergia sp. NSJ-179]MCJ7842091.1 glycoside hydrolase family 43 protein [Lederbergia sp. NSJ-179]